MERRTITITARGTVSAVVDVLASGEVRLMSIGSIDLGEEGPHSVESAVMALENAAKDMRDRERWADVVDSPHRIADRLREAVESALRSYERTSPIEVHVGGQTACWTGYASYTKTGRAVPCGADEGGSFYRYDDAHTEAQERAKRCGERREITDRG